MKLTYNIIRDNIRIFEEAKEKFPIIQKYIDGEVQQNSLQSVGLGEFARFHEYSKQVKSVGFDLIMEDMTWRKLKPILINSTQLDRFRVYLKNRTQKQFIEILKNVEVYDRLLNGRWIRKPGPRRGGRRSSELISSFRQCSVPIINFIIQNDIEVTDGITGADWFRNNTLNLLGASAREMEVTEELLKTLSSSLSESKIDFKKLNLDYISNFINEKVKKMMSIEEGTTIKSIRDINDPSIKHLSLGKSYNVISSYVQSGYLWVSVIDDRGHRENYPFSNFEDVSFQRNSILDSLFAEI
jgi:hypothetical protein